MMREEIVDDVLSTYKSIHKIGINHCNNFPLDDGGEFLFLWLDSFEDQILEEIGTSHKDSGDYYNNIFCDFVFKDADIDETIFQLMVNSTNQYFTDDYSYYQELCSRCDIEDSKGFESRWIGKNVLFVNEYVFYKGSIERFDKNNDIVYIESDSKRFLFPIKQFSSNTCEWEKKFDPYNWRECFNGRITFRHLDK